MNTKRLALSLALSGLCVSATALADQGLINNNQTKVYGRSVGLVKTVIDNARQYKSLHVATTPDAEGHAYQRATGCVSGPEGGAQGVHYVRFDLIGDGVLDPATPEVLIYEPTRWGNMRLVGAEYLTIRDAWIAAHGDDETAPPIIGGQQMHLLGYPNRFAIPAAYALRVWAFKHSPNGMFALNNANVSCEFYQPENS